MVDRRTGNPGTKPLPNLISATYDPDHEDARKLSQRTGELLIQAGLASGVVADPKGFRVDFTDQGFPLHRRASRLDY